MHQLTIPSRPVRGAGTTALARARARGFTLVELMVAMAVGLVVILAASFALISAQYGYHTTDAASELRDNARFATTLVQRLALQVGYQNYVDEKNGVVTRVSATQFGAQVDPDIYGFDNAVVPSAGQLNGIYSGTLSNGSRTCSGDTSCNNGSDILVLRFQGEDGSDGATADGSVINCSGNDEKAITGGSLSTRAYSVFYVDTSGTTNEPTLMCGYRDSAGNWQEEPLIPGVETFQVLYGVYKSGGMAWQRADQITDTADWFKVRRIMIGMLLRSTPNVSQDRSGSITYSPLGNYSLLGKDMHVENDKGTELTISNSDGRIRQTVTFTIDLRNPLNTDVSS